MRWLLQRAAEEVHEHAGVELAAGAGADQLAYEVCAAGEQEHQHGVGAV